MTATFKLTGKLIIGKVLFLFILLGPSILSAQVELTGWGKLIPSDESSIDNSFSEFYTELKTAIDQRNASKVESLIWPEIKMNEYEPAKNGIEYFKSIFTLTDSADMFWTIAGRILQPGVFKDRSEGASFMAPSIWNTDAYSKLFGEEYYLEFAETENLGSAVGDDVPVYSDSTDDSKLIGMLDHEIVKIKNFSYENPVEWFQIELKDGSKGFVRSDNIYLAIFDYLMGFKKFNDKWYISSLERTNV